MKQIKILCVGNSFSCDTIEHVPGVALSLGYEKVKFGNLYVGGCSIRKHFFHAENDTPAYDYYLNEGKGWTVEQRYSIRKAVESEEWDWISIQHGTADGSRYTEEAYYEKLLALCKYLKRIASPSTKLAFNMTWVGDMDFPHEEIASYKGDQMKMYSDITKITKNVVLPLSDISVVSPTGTAVQNARTSSLESLTRDGYHLSLDVGRYIASLTFFSAITGEDIGKIQWAPAGVDEYARKVAITSAANALKSPFSVTEYTD